MFDFELFNIRNERLDGTHKLGFPIAVKQGMGIVVPGLDNAFLQMGEGDKAKVTIPSKHAFGEDFDHKLVKKGEAIYYDVEIKDIPTPLDTSGVKISIFYEEGGAPVKTGDVVGIDFFAYLTNGKLFDSSRRNRSSYEFEVGSNKVIKGLDMAIQKMKVGDKAYIEIPSEWAYDGNGLDDLVPPNADLVYMVTIDYKK